MSAQYYTRLDAPATGSGTGKKDNSPGSKDRNGEFDAFLKSTAGAAAANVEAAREENVAIDFVTLMGQIASVGESIAASIDMNPDNKYFGPIGPPADGGGESSNNNTESPNDEEPVNFFPPGKGSFNGVVEATTYEIGDNMFYVFGHGNRDAVVDNSGPEKLRFYNAKEFDDHMSEKSPNYKKAIESNTPFTLYLFVCESANMAKKISKAHPNAYVVGAEGYVFYGQKDGTPAITGISTLRFKNLHDRDLVGYKMARRIIVMKDFGILFLTERNKIFNL